MAKSSLRNGNRLLLIFTVAAAAAAAGYFLLRGGSQFGEARNATAAVFGGWTYDREDQRLAAAALVKSGLTDYEWEDGRLLVPASRRGEYERVLGEGGAIPKKPSALKQEDLDGLSLFESENRTKMRDLYSSARQLEKTLESFRQIDSASVGPHARREQVGLYPKTIVTASISVTPKEGCAITPELITSITMAARHHLGITDNADISVIDTESGRSWLGSEGDAQSSDSPMAAEQARLENVWTGKLREALGYIPNIRIATAVELEEVGGDSGAESAGDAARRPFGLEFTDAAPAPKAGTAYRPRTIAASIAVPESYIRRALDADSSAGENGGDGFQAKKEELFTQIRETAETMMSPAGGASGPNRRVEVSLYADLSDEERVYRPASETADSPISLLPDPTLSEDFDAQLEGIEESAFALARKMMSGPWTVYVLACLAFAAGLLIRSLFAPRRGRAAEESADESGTADAAEPLEAAPAPSAEAPRPKETRAEPDAPAPARERIDSARLNRILDELEAEDLSLGDNVDSADETIAPAGAPKEIPSFFSAEDEDGTRKDYRIDPRRAADDGPHFAVRESAGDIFDDAPRADEAEVPRGEPPRFTFLADLDADELRALIEKQRPQTVALIARCASPECRRRVLDLLRSRLRDEVERRMRSPDEPDRKVVAAVEASLRESLGAVGERNV